MRHRLAVSALRASLPSLGGLRALAVSVSALTALVACGASAPPPPASPDALHDVASPATAPPTVAASPLAPAARFPIAPMKLVVTNVARHESHALELKSDATVWGDGAAVGKLEGSRVVGDKGDELVAVADDGRVTARGKATPMRFDGDDIVTDAGAKMSIDDGGRITFAAAGHEATRMPITVERYAPAMKRTALLLTVLIATPTE